MIFKNTDCHPDREKCGKTDLVVFKAFKTEDNKKTKKPLLFYEIKTVFKNHESFSKKSFIKSLQKDFLKLKERKSEDNRALFVIVFRKKKAEYLQNIDNISEMINNKLASRLFKNHFDIPINDKKVVVRASSKCIIENTIVLSWEILK